MRDTDRDVRRAVHDAEGGVRVDWEPPDGRLRGRRPPPRGVSTQARRLILILILVGAVVGLVEAGGRVLGMAESPTNAPAADPHGPAIPVVIPKGDDASAIAEVLQDRGVIDDAG